MQYQRPTPAALSVKAAAYAAGISPRAVEHWRARGQVVLPAGKLTPEDGWHLAVVAELIRYGLTVDEAELAWREHGTRCGGSLLIRRTWDGELCVSAVDGLPPPPPSFATINLTLLGIAFRQRLFDLADPSPIGRRVRRRLIEAGAA